jgi:hypothetical protein
MDAYQKYLNGRNWVICVEYTWVSARGTLLFISPRGTRVVTGVKMVNEQLFQWN